MELVIIIRKEDITTSKVGSNFQLETKEGVKIIFHNDALAELIKDYEAQRESDNQ
jgi:hypothetical protein